MADKLPLSALATTDSPHPVRSATRTLNDRLEVTPAPSPPFEQVSPPLVAEHDQDDELADPSRAMPDGSVTFALTGPVAAAPGSDTSTVTSAVTPRLSTPDTSTDTLSLAVAETVGVGVDVGVGGGGELGDGDVEVLGEPDGVGLPDRDRDVVGLGEALFVVAGVGDAVAVEDGAPPMARLAPGA